jgi:flagellar hook-basal body complex protein FliE
MMAIDTGKINAMIAELKATTAIAQGKLDQGGVQGGGDFSQILKNTLDQVSQAQQTAQKMTEDFASGQNVNLQDVMINLQKANLSFQEMVQVRNKLVSAYHDIMNIQV